MTIELKLLDGGVAMIALNRPEVRNALNLEMCDALLRFTQEVSKQDIRVVFVRGNGPAFCGGADLNERKGKSEEWIRERRMRAFAAYAAHRIAAHAVRCAGAWRGDRLGGRDRGRVRFHRRHARARRSARRRRSAARSAPRNACRASSASGWRRT